MTRIKNFEDIASWKKGRQLTKNIYDATSTGNFSRDFGLKDQIRRAAEHLGSAYKHAAYAVQMGTRPQTMYGLNDSPVFLAAYMLDHDPTSYATLIAPAFVDGDERGLTRDDILDNITMFWLTNTGVSTAKSYWEYLGYGSFADVRNVTIPVAVSVFPDELFRAPRSWAEKAYPNLVHFNEVDRGGHFAAWEEPQLFTEELRAAFRSLR